MARQSLAWRSIATATGRAASSPRRKTGHPDEGGFFLAMAYHQLGDKARARTWFDRSDNVAGGVRETLRGAREGVGAYNRPEPAILRRTRAEAAALLGVKGPQEHHAGGPHPGPGPGAPRHAAGDEQPGACARSARPLGRGASALGTGARDPPPGPGPGASRDAEAR